MTIIKEPATQTKECPKCFFVSQAAEKECPRCGVLIDKVAKVESRRREETERWSQGLELALERLAAADALFIKQQVERLEAFTGWETPNQYAISDSMNNVLFYAAEKSDSFAELLSRLFLKAARPFTIHVVTPSGEPVVSLERPFRFFFHEVNVIGPRGEHLGTVEKQFTLLNRIYRVTDEKSGETFEIYGPMWRPWTFKIRRNGHECGMIKKKWSGALKEMFTDADSFGIEFPRDIDARRKAVLLGAVFLVDFVHFEDNN
jgi:hypothetical protein